MKIHCIGERTIFIRYVGLEQPSRETWYIISIVLAALLIYFVIVFCSSNSLAGLSISNLKKDGIYPVWIALLVIIPLYVASMIILFCLDRTKRHLTHIVFIIAVGFVISLLITVTYEWYPSVIANSSISFKNMSVSVERPSPFIIPIRSIIYPNDYNESLIVKIYNYSSIDPVSVSMSIPSNVYFDYSGFNNEGYNSTTKSFQYTSEIGTKHSGRVFNSTAEYLINIDYRNIPILQKQKNSPEKVTKLLTQTNSSNLTKLNITDITSTRPLNRFNTIDNDLNTTWSAAGNGQSITYVFDKRYNVSKIGIAFFRGDVRQNYVEINKENFTSSGRTLKLENFTLKTPLVNTKSLQIIGHGNSGGGNSKPTYNAFSEIRIYGPNPIDPPAIVKPDNTIYHNSVPFSWSVRMTDLSLTTYFWIVMAGVVTSRFMSLILGRTEEHEGHPKKDPDFQIIGWKDGLGILFSFIIAVILFSSFSQQSSSLTMMVLFNISIAFAFGFGFDKTLEVAPRFSPHYVVNKRQGQSNEGGQQEQPAGNEN